MRLLRSVWALCDGMLRTLSGGEPSSNKWIILCASDKSVRYAKGVEAFIVRRGGFPNPPEFIEEENDVSGFIQKIQTKGV